MKNYKHFAFAMILAICVGSVSHSLSQGSPPGEPSKQIMMSLKEYDNSVPLRELGIESFQAFSEYSVEFNNSIGVLGTCFPLELIKLVDKDESLFDLTRFQFLTEIKKKAVLFEERKLPSNSQIIKINSKTKKGMTTLIETISSTHKQGKIVLIASYDSSINSSIVKVLEQDFDVLETSDYYEVGSLSKCDWSRLANDIEALEKIHSRTSSVILVGSASNLSKLTKFIDVDKVFFPRLDLQSFQAFTQYKIDDFLKEFKSGAFPQALGYVEDLRVKTQMSRTDQIRSEHGFVKLLKKIGTTEVMPINMDMLFFRTYYDLEV